MTESDTPGPAETTPSEADDPYRVSTSAAGFAGVPARRIGFSGLILPTTLAITLCGALAGRMDASYQVTELRESASVVPGIVWRATWQSALYGITFSTLLAVVGSFTVKTVTQTGAGVYGALCFCLPVAFAAVSNWIDATVADFMVVAAGSAAGAIGAWLGAYRALRKRATELQATNQPSPHGRLP